MKNSDYVAALDLGTSKIIAMAARKNEQGMISVLCADKTKPDGCIKRGAVYNINDTVVKARSALFALNRKLGDQVGRIYVGIGGQSVHSQVHTIKRAMSGEIVTKETIDSLYEECKGYKPDGWEVLAIVSPEFYIDGKAEAKPIGVACQMIEASYRLILGRPTLLSNLNKSIKERILVDIAGYIIVPLATAEAELTQSEKEKGCALVEFGAGVTYVSVYKNNILHYLVTIPLGGNVITKDLCDMNLTAEEAEILKVGGDIQNENLDFKKFEAILQARCQEIADNVVEQLHQSGYAGQLGAGIVVTGGGSNLIDLRDMLNEKTSMAVRQAATKKTLVNNMSEWADDPACSTIIGMLSIAEENCAKSKRSEPAPANRYETTRREPPKTPDTDLFDKDEDLKREAEARRLELEQKEKERKEREKQERERQRKEKTSSLFGGWRKRIEKVSDTLFGDEQDEKQERNNHHTDNNNNPQNS